MCYVRDDDVVREGKMRIDDREAKNYGLSGRNAGQCRRAYGPNGRAILAMMKLNAA